MKISGLEERRCPVCQSQDVEIINTKIFKGIVGLPFKEFLQNLGICRYCGMVYVSKYLSDSDLENYYSSLSNYEMEASEALKNQCYRQIRFIKGVLSSPKSVLDIGCALGYLLGIYKEQGIENILGVDPSVICSQIAKKEYGVNVITDFFTRDIVNKQYGLVILSHVIEHVKNPELLLQDIRKILDDKGVIFIETPSIDLLNSLDPYYLSFEHINYFNFSTLKNFMERNGFRLLKDVVFKGSPAVMPFYSTMGSLWIKQNYYLENKKIIQKYLSAILNRKKHLKKKIKRIFSKEKKVAFWGAGTLSAELIAEMGLSSKDILCFFDNDPKKNGKKMLGIPIIKPLMSTDFFKSKIDAIVISSWSNQDEIYESIKFLRNGGVKIYNIFPTLVGRGSY